MYKFHYGYVSKTFDAKLLFTDTDRLVYEIKDKNVYRKCFKTDICLISVDIQKILTIMIVQTKKC